MSVTVDIPIDSSSAKTVKRGVDTAQRDLNTELGHLSSLLKRSSFLTEEGYDRLKDLLAALMTVGATVEELRIGQYIK